MLNMLVRLICFCIIAIPLFAEFQEQKNICLAGHLIKIHYPTPCAVKNVPFGWYLELNKASQDKIKKSFQALSKEDQQLFNMFNTNFQIVHCINCGDDTLLQAHLFENQFVTIKGKLGAPFLSNTILCFVIKPDTIESPAKPHSLACPPHFDNFDYFYSRFLLSKPLENEYDLPSLLRLPDNVPQKLVQLKGKLILRLIPGPPEYGSIEGGDRADYCWMLSLDEESFQIAMSTKVPEPELYPQEILRKSNHREVFLSFPDNIGEFCLNHKDQEIVVQGYLFHAHTAHHYTPILMDVTKWSP